VDRLPVFLLWDSLPCRPRRYQFTALHSSDALRRWHRHSIGGESIDTACLSMRP
jgi:hypothetical protein